MNHTQGHTHFRPGSILMVAACMLLLVSLFGILWQYKRTHPAYIVPDEQSAAYELLAQKFVGPGYFHFGTSGNNERYGQLLSKFHIPTEDARSQIDRITKERNLEPEQVKKLNGLIDRISEPPNSRIVGQSQINLLRLNLALDELAPREHRPAASTNVL